MKTCNRVYIPLVQNSETECQRLGRSSNLGFLKHGVQSWEGMATVATASRCTLHVLLAYMHLLQSGSANAVVSVGTQAFSLASSQLPKLAGKGATVVR